MEKQLLIVSGRKRLDLSIFLKSNDYIKAYMATLSWPANTGQVHMLIYTTLRQ